MTDRSHTPAAVRLARGTVLDPETGCHNWTGGTNIKGYAE